jgi:DNA-binding NarL/FixJ family response regulator
MMLKNPSQGHHHPGHAMSHAATSVLPINSLIFCSDAQFLTSAGATLEQMNIARKVVSNLDDAAAQMRTQEFDVILVNWREVGDPMELLGAVRRSALNQDCILVAIVTDEQQVRHAFAAGIHFLIHAPASEVQIERCLRAAYCATVSRRRKQHREPVNLEARISTRLQPSASAMIVNLSQGGAGLKLVASAETAAAYLSVGEQVGLRFALPESGDKLLVTGTVVWSSPQYCGIRFTHIPDQDRQSLDLWLTHCVERSLADLSERVRAVGNS